MLALTTPRSIRSELTGPNADSWSLDVQVKYVFPATKYAADGLALTWYNSEAKPPRAVLELVGAADQPAFQGSVYVGEKGAMYSPAYDTPTLFPRDKFADFKMPAVTGDDHYLQFVEAVRGNGTTSAPFSYSGPLTELVLLGCLATRFPKADLTWDAKALTVTNRPEANRFVRKTYRKGWEVEGL